MGGWLVIAAIASTFIAAIAAALTTLWSAALAIRAKDRLRTKLHHEFSAQAQLVDVQLVEALTKAAAERRPLSEEEAHAARQLIEAAARDLPETDRSMLAKGLNQPSKLGERRYIRDLISAA